MRAKTSCCRRTAGFFTVVVVVLAAITAVYRPTPKQRLDEFMRATRPFPVPTVNAVGELVRDVFGIDHRWLWNDAEMILAAATARTGLSDFGEDADAMREALHRFIASADLHANLHLIGSILCRETLVNFASRRLQIVDYAKENPEIADIKIKRPIFIAGLPRTGTTLIHGMLSTCIDGLRAPLQWELYCPFPAPHGDDSLNQNQISEASWLLDGVMALMPRLQRLHEESTFDASEDIHVQAYAFQSRLLSTFFYAPDYLMWLQRPNADNSGIMRWHTKFVQHLSSRESRHRGRRWIFKAPRYVGMLDAVYHQYPDATVIHTMRHPEQVIPSMVCLDTLTLGVSSDDPPDTFESGSLIQKFYGRCLNDTLRWRLRHKEEIANGRMKLVDVHLDQLKQNLTDVVGRVLEAAEIEPSAEERRCLTEFPSTFGNRKYKPYRMDPHLASHNFDDDGHFLPPSSPLLTYYNQFRPVLANDVVAAATEKHGRSATGARTPIATTVESTPPQPEL